MPRSRKILFFTVIAFIVISACNLPTDVVATDTSPDLAGTITAQALLLQFTPTETQSSADSSPNQPEIIPQSVTATPETIQSSSVIPTSTPTPGVTTVTVSAETNCRRGPSISYVSDYSLPVGQTAEVIGKNTPTNYWIINIPGKAGATCWLWGKYATINGDSSGLKEYEIPATPTPSPTATVAPPAPVSNLSEQNTCSKGAEFLQNISGTISWKDNSNNENGFNIYQRLDGANWADVLVGSASANSTSYTFNVQTVSKAPFSLKVEAYNDAGASQRKSINIAFNCP
jgi:hypothetical protein